MRSFLFVLWIMGVQSFCFLKMSDPSFRPERVLFQSFIETFQKTYTVDSEEGNKKFGHFCTNVERIQKHNRETRGYKLGMNQFTDESLVTLEKKLLVCDFTNTTTTGFRHAVSFTSLPDPPPRVDWVGRGKVSRIKNQGSCGSCWAFSTVGAIESMLRIRHQSAIDLSEQQLVDCSSSNHACNGGLMDRAINDINTFGGLMPEKDHPYTGKKNTCRVDYLKTVPQTKNLRYDFVRPHDVTEMKQRLVAHGPLCSAVEVDPLHFLFYKEGIYDLEKQNHRLNHAVLLTGYTDDHETPYWRIKNSWGTTWGEDGFMRLAIRGKEGVAGLHLYNLYLE